MKFELAEKLKEGGFPKAGLGPRGFSVYKGNGLAGVVNAPTLEELIVAVEALPRTGDFYLSHNRKDGLWSADTTLPAKWAHAGFATPAEAVARLWLALHQHETLA